MYGILRIVLDQIATQLFSYPTDLQKLMTVTRTAFGDDDELIHFDVIWKIHSLSSQSVNVDNDIRIALTQHHTTAKSITHEYYTQFIEIVCHYGQIAYDFITKKIYSFFFSDCYRWVGPKLLIFAYRKPINDSNAILISAASVSRYVSLELTPKQRTAQRNVTRNRKTEKRTVTTTTTTN